MNLKPSSVKLEAGQASSFKIVVLVLVVLVLVLLLLLLVVVVKLEAGQP